MCIGAQLTLPQNAHSQLQPKDNDSLDITIEFDYSPSTVSLELNQNTFIKTSIDGFQMVPNPYINPPNNTVLQIGIADRTVKLIGTAQLTWQPKGLYEIIMYTDNITELGFAPFLSGIGTTGTPAQRTTQKANFADRLTGLYPLYTTNPLSVQLPQGFLFFKAWTQATAARNQDTAPHVNGAIHPRDYYGTFLLAQEQGRTILHRADFDNEAFFDYLKAELDPIYTTETINTIRLESQDFARADVLSLNILTQDELDHLEPSYGIVPEKNAVNRNIPGASWGSFRKIIASTRYYFKEYEIELSFATDLSDPILLINHNATFITEDKYIGKIVIDMLGN